ncbi:HDOD domain-containing protein [Vibrio fluvialis]
MFSYIARQPIFDNNLNIFGYELLYRNGPKNSFPNISTHGITQEIFIEQHLTYQGVVLNKKIGFVNFDYNDLVNGLPLEFPKDKYIIEVLETCIPDIYLMNALLKLKDAGYTIALDDFCTEDPRWHPFIMLADIIKFDLKKNSLDSIKLLIKNLKRKNKKILAEKVEDYDEFHKANKLGFDFFQGYFFSKPQMIKKPRLDESFKANIELLKEVSKSNFSLSIVEKIISQSPSLTIRLLNYVNGQVSIRSNINSLKQAITYLGKKRLKRFSSYFIISILPTKKPKSLFLNSLYRANFLQTIALAILSEDLSDKAYITGMLSLIDALLDVDIKEIIPTLNLAPEISNAILNYNGPLGELLLLVNALEQGHWQYIDNFQKSNEKISPSIYQQYINIIEQVHHELE